MESPNYYAIIPANVRYCEQLSASEKLLYGEIMALCFVDGVCVKTNRYFATLYNVSERAVQKWINNLDKVGFIRSDVNWGKRTIRIA